MSNTVDYSYTLTICILTLNEKNNVERMLESIKGVGNEIIAMDEYSTDGTREILKKYNVKIIDCKLNNDYSNLRNTAIANSTGQWILFIDADETLDVPLRDALSSRELLKYCEKFGFDAVVFKRRNLYEDGTELMRFYPDHQARLFKNNGKIKYKGRVHEMLTGFAKVFISDYHLIHRKINCSTEDILRMHEKYTRLSSIDRKL